MSRSTIRRASPSPEAPARRSAVSTGGAITIGNGNLTFAGGNTDLADNISVNGGAGKVTNEGVLRLAAPETITGNFVQTASGYVRLLCSEATRLGSTGRSR